MTNKTLHSEISWVETQKALERVSTPSSFAVGSNEQHDPLRNVNIIAYSDLEGLPGFLAQFSSKHEIPASESETSMVLAIRKEMVNMERTKEGFVGRFKDKIDLVISQGIEALIKIGVIGDPLKAEARREEYLEL